jgi:hypothetical protein
MIECIMSEDNNNDNKFSADLVSNICQFCGEPFGRPTELSLHYKENTDEIGKEK